MESIVIEVLVYSSPTLIFTTLEKFGEWPLFAPETVSETPERVQGNRLKLKTRITGSERCFEATLLQRTEKSLSWATEEGTPTSGSVVVETLAAGNLRVTFTFQYTREGIVESFYASTGLVQRRLEMDLERFKHAVEREHEQRGLS
ncbi:hypothetical protein DES53_11518 [Roseimicrobium gellanilyticum]|uniref:Polyketide cyclase/dehydrase/lipid transport protein n=1 Tax=Roseimicrobium gellanilyticum TaxID=748857 RepID=A0A366H639_9BACT|nr:hypothetical protein [Roseimicrobium gellanilyticum]RBP36877.1 hypothetical protein DES53_11518 [Roseimicrobium gellanilyticum]